MLNKKAAAEICHGATAPPLWMIDLTKEHEVPLQEEVVVITQTVLLVNIPQTKVCGHQYPILKQ